MVTRSGHRSLGRYDFLSVLLGLQRVGPCVRGIEVVPTGKLTFSIDDSVSRYQGSDLMALRKGVTDGSSRTQRKGVGDSPIVGHAAFGNLADEFKYLMIVILFH